MNIIYHCYGGAHSSVTAAAIHLGWLSSSQIPMADDLMKLPYFDVQISDDHGVFRFLGRDESGNRVYIIGRRNLGSNFENLVHGLADILQVPKEDILLVNTMPAVNWMMVLGGFLSRGLKLQLIGRPIVIKGVRHSFFKFVALVEKVKKIYSASRLSKQNFRSVLS